MLHLVPRALATALVVLLPTAGVAAPSATQEAADGDTERAEVPAPEDDEARPRARGLRPFDYATSSPAAADDPASDAPLADPSSRVPNRMWAGVELGTILTVSGVYYWHSRGELPGWHLGTWREWPSRHVPMVDKNGIETNFIGHGTFGGMFHLAARTNDLGMLESAAWGLGASLMWEYVAEWRGKADVNDIIVTTPAGIAVGEFFHKLGRLVHQQQGSSPAWGVARWTAGYSQSITNTLTRNSAPRGPRIDSEFHVGLGVDGTYSSEARAGERAEGAGMQSSVRVGGTLSAQRGRPETGAAWVGVRDGATSSLDLALAGGSAGQRSLFLLSDTVLAGWRYTDVDSTEDRGTEVTVATSTALRYLAERYTTWRDQFAMVHLPGLALDWAHHRRGWRMRGLARFHVDYGGVRGLAYEDWQAAHPEERGISVLQDHTYYHAWGGSARLAQELSVSRLTLAGSVFFGAYRPHTGLDEHRQGRPHHEPDSTRPHITMEQHIRTRLLEYELWLRSDLRRGAYVEGRAAVRGRNERFEELETEARSMRAGVALGASF